MSDSTPCRCQWCGREFTYISGFTPSRTVCYFCGPLDVRKEGERLAAAPPDAVPEDEEAIVNEREAYVSDHEDGASTLLMVVIGAVIGALLWALIILAVRWVLELPPPALIRLTAVGLLFAGTGIVFGALAHMEITIAPTPDRSRERRPVGAAERRGALQRPANALPPGAAHVAPTAPPSAGGRALSEAGGR